MKKKLLFTFALLLTAVTGAWADSSCGGGLTWTLSSGTLTISKTGEGDGAMPDYDLQKVPWYNEMNNITSVVIGDGVTGIGQYAFFNCSNLASLTIGSSLQSIGVQAFSRCSKLASVNLPASVTKIEDNAFYDCSNLSSVVIHATSVPTCGNDAFGLYKSGRKIFVPAASVDTYKAGWTTYANDIIGYNGTCGATGHESDVLYAMDGESPNKTLFVCGTGAMADYDYDSMPWYSQKDAITSVVIGDGVTDIGKYAFYEHSHLASLTIGNSLETIGVWALALVRIVLCLFPQNGWLENSSDMTWGIIRNVPFVILGAVICWLYWNNKRKNRTFRLVWLYILLSFLFYIPVAVAAGIVPMLGMLMLPKTICYVLLIIAFLQATGKKHR